MFSYAQPEHGKQTGSKQWVFRLQPGFQFRSEFLSSNGETTDTGCLLANAAAGNTRRRAKLIISKRILPFLPIQFCSTLNR